MYFCISFTFYLSTPVGATWALTIAKIWLYRNLIIHGDQRFKTISYWRLKNTEFVWKPFYSVGFVFRVLFALWLTLVAGETRKTTAPRRWMIWVRAKEWLMERGLFRIPSHRRRWFNSWLCSRKDSSSVQRHVAGEGADVTEVTEREGSSPHREGFPFWFLVVCLSVKVWWFCCCFRLTGHRVRDNAAKVRWTGWCATVETKAWLSQPMTFELCADGVANVKKEAGNPHDSVASVILSICFCSIHIYSRVQLNYISVWSACEQTDVEMRWTCPGQPFKGE